VEGDKSWRSYSKVKDKGKILSERIISPKKKHYLTSGKESQ